MTPPTIIPVTATLEALLAECVGAAPELVKLNDWRTIALRLSRRLEECGLRIIKNARDMQDRAQLVGPVREGEIILVIADGPNQAIVASRGMPISNMPPDMQDTLWRAMLRDAVCDLAANRKEPGQ